MKNKKISVGFRKNAVFFGVGVVLVMSLLLPSTSIVHAAIPPGQVILTWQANNFYPADYVGKALVTPGTPVSVSVEYAENGKLVDLSRASIAWYVDENFVGSGAGKKEIVFISNGAAGGSHFVRVSILSGSETLDTSIRIPIVNPKTVIDAPFPNDTVPASSKISLSASPFFWNIPDIQGLQFTWQANGSQAQATGDTSLDLTVGTPRSASDQFLLLSLLTQNSTNPLEFSNDHAKLIIQ